MNLLEMLIYNFHRPYYWQSLAAGDSHKNARISAKKITGQHVTQH